MSSAVTLESLVESANILSTLQGTEAKSKPLLPSDSETVTNRVQELSIATGTSEDEVRPSVVNEDGVYETQAQTLNNNITAESIIDFGRELGLEPTDVLALVEGRTEKVSSLPADQFLLAQSMMAEDGSITPAAHSTLSKISIFDQIMQRKIEENDDGAVRKFFTFLDVNILRAITLGAFEGVTFRSNREGKEIREAFTSGMTNEEFESWAEDYIDERSNEGIFSRDSIWTLHTIAHNKTYAGNDPYAPVNAIFGVVDIATLGSTKWSTAALKAGFKGGKQGGIKVAEALKIRKPVDAVALTEGGEAAAEVLAKSVDDAGVQADQTLAGRYLPEELDPVQSPSARPSNAAGTQSVIRRTIIEKLETLNRKFAFGEYLPEETIFALATRTAQNIVANSGNKFVNSFRYWDEGSNDYKLAVRFGKNERGTPFKTKGDAQKVADLSEEANLSVIKNDTGYGWFLQAEERLDVLNKVDPIDRFDKGGFISDTISKLFGAASIRLGERLGTKFLQAESGQSLVKEIVNPFEKKINSLKPKEQDNLAKYFEELRDGQGKSKTRDAPSVEQFTAQWTVTHGQAPSKKVQDAYEAVLEINDASWHIQSSAALKKAVNQNGRHLTIADDFEQIGYRVDGRKVTMPEGEFVWSPIRNKALRVSELGSDAVVYKLAAPFGREQGVAKSGFIFVTDIRKTRALERVDVMPYNIGGPRNNGGLRWFLGSDVEVTLKSGNKYSGGFNTLLGSFSKSQILKAKGEVNAIVAKVNQLLASKGVTDISQLSLTKAEYDELGKVIRANNTWRPTLTDLEDLVKIKQTHGITFTKELVEKARDQKPIIRVDSEGRLGDDPVFMGSNAAETLSIRLNKSRSDTPPLEFGGKDVKNINPIAAIADQFGSEVYGYANRAATQDALVGWVKLAQANPNVIDNLPQLNALSPQDFLGRFLSARIVKSNEHTDLANQLIEQQRVIKARLNMRTDSSVRWENFTSSATEAIFNKSGFKVDFSKIGLFSDPSSQLLKVGFYSKFGFFNPDQFTLQGLHGLTVAAISPRQGSKALALSMPMMMITSGMLKPEARALAVTRLAQVSRSMGLDEDELKLLMQYIDDSGRNIIDTTILELQAPQNFGVSSTLGQRAKKSVGTMLDKSTLFFKEGERVSRMTGMVTAFLEHRAKRPNINPLSAEGKAWIMSREQDLTFRMTSASRSFAQSGLMRVPTQWLTFTLRAMENIAIGRNFNAGERARMAFVLGPMYGLTGVGMGRFAGYASEKMGFSSDDPESIKVFNSVKYGLLDRLLSESFGVETAYAKRVAPIEQVEDTMKKLFTDEFYKVILGPSGEITGDFVAAAISTVGALASGQTSIAREDLTQLLRNISSVDKAAKINELIETGNYRSRTRKLSVGNLPEFPSALATTFGATPAPVANFYDYQDRVYKLDSKWRKFEKNMRNKANYALRLMIDGDEEDFKKGEKIYKEIQDKIWSSAMSDTLKSQMTRRMVRGENIPDIMRNAIRLKTEVDANFLSSQMEGQ